MLLITTLFTCSRQVAMEEKPKQTMLPLELIEQKNIPGKLCNPYTSEDYFLVYRKNQNNDDSPGTLEIWDKIFNELIDTIESSQIIEVLKKFYNTQTQKTFNQKEYKEFIAYFMPRAKIIESSVIITAQGSKGTKYIKYDLLKKEFEVIFDTTRKTIVVDTISTDDDKVKLPYINKEVFYWQYLQHTNYITIANPENSSLEITDHNSLESITITFPPKYNVMIARATMMSDRHVFCGNSHILTYFRHQDYICEKELFKIYNVKTGQPIKRNNKNIDLTKDIPNWEENWYSLKWAIFGKKDKFIILLCDDKQKEIILFDLETPQTPKHYVLPKECGGISIHLAENDTKIIIASEKNQQIYIFKNPLVNPDIDEPERRKYIQDQEDTKMVDEKPCEIVINGMNGIRIPVHRSFLSFK